MKPLAILLFSAALSLAAESSRTWTDTKGRTIQGTLRAKTDTVATILTPNGKKSDLKLESLSVADQEYVHKADLTPEVDDADLITSRVTGLKGGYKTVEVTARAGNKPLDVLAVSVSTNQKIRHTVKAGEMLSFQFTAGDKYSVTGSVDGVVLDSEDSLTKTGITRLK